MPAVCCSVWLQEGMKVISEPPWPRAVLMLFQNRCSLSINVHWIYKFKSHWFQCQMHEHTCKANQKHGASAIDRGKMSLFLNSFICFCGSFPSHWGNVTAEHQQCRAGVGVRVWSWARQQCEHTGGRAKAWWVNHHPELRFCVLFVLAHSFSNRIAKTSFTWNTKPWRFAATVNITVELIRCTSEIKPHS